MEALLKLIHKPCLSLHAYSTCQTAEEYECRQGRDISSVSNQFHYCTQSQCQAAEEYDVYRLKQGSDVMFIKHTGGVHKEIGQKQSVLKYITIVLLTILYSAQNVCMAVCIRCV